MATRPPRWPVVHNEYAAIVLRTGIAAKVTTIGAGCFVFTGVRGRRILRRSDTGSRIAPVLWSQNRPKAPHLSLEVDTKYIHVISAEFEPMIESVRQGHRLYLSKKSYAAATSALTFSNNSQWVTSRRKCRQSISMGLSQGL
jgi:hypothetical protein